MERYSNIESKEQLAYLKRQDLQQLCKLHGLKAKRKNEEMIQDLSEVLVFPLGKKVKTSEEVNEETNQESDQEEEVKEETEEEQEEKEENQEEEENKEETSDDEEEEEWVDASEGENQEVNEISEKTDEEEQVMKELETIFPSPEKSSGDDEELSDEEEKFRQLKEEEERLEKEIKELEQQVEIQNKPTNINLEDPIAQEIWDELNERVKSAKKTPSTGLQFNFSKAQTTQEKSKSAKKDFKADFDVIHQKEFSKMKSITEVFSAKKSQKKPAAPIEVKKAPSPKRKIEETTTKPTSNKKFKSENVFKRLTTEPLTMRKLIEITEPRRQTILPSSETKSSTFKLDNPTTPTNIPNQNSRALSLSTGTKPKPKFNLQESLKRPLNYKPYTGAIKSAIETSVSKVSQSLNQSASKENIPKKNVNRESVKHVTKPGILERKEKTLQKQDEARIKTTMTNRGIKSN